MRRVLPPAEFRTWFSRFLPGAARGEPKALFTPATVTDRADPQLVHLDGLNLSRAWAMKSIAAALPAGDPGAGCSGDLCRPTRRIGARARGQRELRGRALAGLVRCVFALNPVSA